jgi:hypothetical protein
LRADAVTIPRGNSITLTWNANNATTVDIQPGIGPVTPPGTGSRQVSPHPRSPIPRRQPAHVTPLPTRCA